MNNNAVINECVIKCKVVFGFNKSYVYKLISAKAQDDSILSKESAASEILDFAKDIESLYGKDIYKVINTVLIDKKTLKQHMLLSVSSPENLHKYFESASAKINQVKISKANIEPEKVALRLLGIGRAC